ncbi:MAG: hypothetical protein VYC34_02120, partial [Planctomycetota bacterium]|nr:hypothetical protein [Planctomycetota bacterium]
MQTEIPVVKESVMRGRFGRFGLGVSVAAMVCVALGCAAASAQSAGGSPSAGGAAGDVFNPITRAANPGEPERFEYFEGLRFDEAIPSPEEFLGYPLGTHFTRHHEQTAYLEALDEASDRVTMERYGFTHQRRPLHIVTISSPANMARLDEIL